MHPAGMPSARSASTWSRIREISGEITITSASRATAGSWKQSDLPPPVGRIASVSRPCSTEAMMSRWPRRNAPSPKRARSVASRSAGGVG
jgi:hypothetical protein